MKTDTDFQPLICELHNPLHQALKIADDGEAYTNEGLTEPTTRQLEQIETLNQDLEHLVQATLTIAMPTHSSFDTD